MGNEQLAAKRRPAACRTGSRKGKKNKENVASSPVTPTPRPKPRPVKKGQLSALNLHNSLGDTELGDADSAAIDALMALGGVSAAPQKRAPSPMVHILDQVMNVGTDEGDEIEEDSEEEEDELDEKEEHSLNLQDVQELDGNSNLELPGGTPRRSRPEFRIPFEVPFNGMYRGKPGVKSSDPYPYPPKTLPFMEGKENPPPGVRVQEGFRGTENPQGFCQGYTFIILWEQVKSTME
ncbi:hypothetical protein JOM56_002811 [Amanita muscaria]